MPSTENDRNKHGSLVAIANSRLLSTDAKHITFKWKDYRLKGQKRYITLTLKNDEFIRRFLIQILPSRFHRIRHYGFLSNTVRAKQLQYVRNALNFKAPEPDTVEDNDSVDDHLICKKCAGLMQLIDVFEGTVRARAPPLVASA